MAIKTWQDLNKKFQMCRHEMTIEQEKEFINYCFDLYEKEGFHDKFWSQGGDFQELIGKTFNVLSRCTEDECDLECLPMWNIEFKNGVKIQAYPDEIIFREMKENGYVESV